MEEIWVITLSLCLTRPLTHLHQLSNLSQKKRHLMILTNQTILWLKGIVSLSIMQWFRYLRSNFDFKDGDTDYRVFKNWWLVIWFWCHSLHFRFRLKGRLYRYLILKACDSNSSALQRSWFWFCFCFKHHAIPIPLQQTRLGFRNLLISQIFSLPKNCWWFGNAMVVTKRRARDFTQNIRFRSIMWYVSDWFSRTHPRLSFYLLPVFAVPTWYRRNCCRFSKDQQPQIPKLEIRTKWLL